MQKIIQGIDSIDTIIGSSKKVLLVCDSSFPYLTIRERIERISLPIVKFDRFTPNPLYEDVCKGVELFNAEQCDIILAVGGGSAMDVAKCIKLYCRMPKDTFFLEQPYDDTGVKLIAIPTTAGTGSESTRYAVIYYKGKKQSVTHNSIIPDIAILEPSVLKSLPVYQKKCTMLDALCQGIESWWSVNSTEESKEYSKIAVETIIKNWHAYIFENTDEAAQHIMQAANYAGRAICITQTTAPHAFSYKLTSLYELPHGHAVAICLPHIWEYMLLHLDECIDKRGKDYLDDVFQQIAMAMGAESPKEAISEFKRILSFLEINSPKSNKGSELELLATSVNPVRLKNNPVGLSAEMIYRLYNFIVK